MQWCQTGALARAAQEALVLAQVPDRLQELMGQWSTGNFRELPPWW